MINDAIALILSASPAVPTSTPQPWAQYGAVGAMAFILLVYAWSSIQRERKRADDAEQARREAEQALRQLYEKVLPVMTEATGSMSRLSDMMPELIAALQLVARDRRS